MREKSSLWYQLELLTMTISIQQNGGEGGRDKSKSCICSFKDSSESSRIKIHQHGTVSLFIYFNLKATLGSENKKNIAKNEESRKERRGDRKLAASLQPGCVRKSSALISVFSTVLASFKCPLSSN